MSERHAPDGLLDFPCPYQFKAFGEAADSRFGEAVYRAVNQVVNVGHDAVRTRCSSGGRYQCVTVVVRLENSAQLSAIYAILRGVDGLCYLL